MIASFIVCDGTAECLFSCHGDNGEIGTEGTTDPHCYHVVTVGYEAVTSDLELSPDCSHGQLSGGRGLVNSAWMNCLWLN